MNKTKSRNTVIITICIASTLICIALTFWGNWKNNGVLTTDAFIGVMATFIGICATIIVGVQIVNHLELRKMQTSIKTIEEERKELEYQRKAFSVEMYNTRLSIGNALAIMAIMAKDNEDTAIEFTSLVHSIIIDDWSSMKGEALLTRYKRLSEISGTIMGSISPAFCKDFYDRLSILVVPKDIKHYDEIMTIHYQLLSDLKSRYNQETTDIINEND